MGGGGGIFNIKVTIKIELTLLIQCHKMQLAKAYKDIGKKGGTELNIDSVQFSSDGGIHPGEVMGVSLMRTIVVLDNLSNQVARNS